MLIAGLVYWRWKKGAPKAKVEPDTIRMLETNRVRVRSVEVEFKLIVIWFEGFFWVLLFPPWSKLSFLNKEGCDFREESFVFKADVGCDFVAVNDCALFLLLFRILLFTGLMSFATRSREYQVWKQQHSCHLAMKKEKKRKKQKNQSSKDARPPCEEKSQNPLYNHYQLHQFPSNGKEQILQGVRSTGAPQHRRLFGLNCVGWYE